MTIAKTSITQLFPEHMSVYPGPMPSTAYSVFSSINMWSIIVGLFVFFTVFIVLERVVNRFIPQYDQTIWQCICLLIAALSGLAVTLVMW